MKERNKEGSFDVRVLNCSTVQIEFSKANGEPTSQTPPLEDPPSLRSRSALGGLPYSIIVWEHHWKGNLSAKVIMDFRAWQLELWVSYAPSGGIFHGHCHLPRLNISPLPGDN